MTNSNDQLAVHGGPKTIVEPFVRYNPIGQEEVAAVTAVVESGVLSKFVGVWCEDFFGGERVQAFERAWESYFGVEHAITVNSATSGLIAAVGAIGVEPGDEIIVSPWTMCASATAILHWNAIPVFADIERETFCIDPASVEANITPYTKAIMAVDIFGHPADMDALMAIADRHGLKVIVDTAQAPGSTDRGGYAGTPAHVGCYSLNYHKHIHTGEGGVLVTNDAILADRMRLIRNHAEGVVGDKGVTDLRNMVGHNFRLGEMEAAIGIEQLKKLKGFVESRQRAAARLTAALTGLTGLRTPIVKPGCTHVFYVYPLVLDIAALGVSRAVILEALEAEGLEGLAAGYVNVHRLPMYQQKMAYGSKGFPWVDGVAHRDVSYDYGICPVAEALHDETFLGFAMCLHEMTDHEVDLMVEAFHKVWLNLPSLRDRS